MDNRWFKEDRKLPKHEQLEAFEKTKKALKNSTLFQRRMSEILTEMIAETERSDEDFSKPNWERENVANISRRKTLREVFKLVQFK